MAELPAFEQFTTGLKDDAVTIIANPKTNEERFTVSPIRIGMKSQFFARAFNGPFSEAEKREIEIPDVDIHSLKTILYFSYHDVIPDDAYPDHHEETFLVRLWVLADRLIAPAVQAIAVKDFCLLLSDSFLEPETIMEIYSCTSENSILRKLAAYDVASSILSPWDEDDRSESLSRCYMELEGFGPDVSRAIRAIILVTGSELMERSDIFTKQFIRDH